MSDRVACPWCGYALRDMWDYGWDADDAIETECPDCDGHIILRRHVSCHYYADRVMDAAGEKTA